VVTKARAMIVCRLEAGAPSRYDACQITSAKSGAHPLNRI